MSDNGERTEQPTAKRLKEARDRGQVARSRDLSVALSSLSLTLALASLGPGIAAQMATRMVAGINRMGDNPLEPISPGELMQAVFADGKTVAMSVGPLMLVAAIVGVLGTIGQTGWVFATESLKLKWENLSPAKGLQRLGPSHGGLEFLKAFLAVSALCTIAWKIISAQLHDGGLVARMAPSDAARYGWESVRQLLWQGALAMMALGVGDFLVQRWRTNSSLKMTKQEVKDEHKEQDGDPKVKNKIRSLRIERHRTKVERSRAPDPRRESLDTHHGARRLHDKRPRRRDFLARRRPNSHLQPLPLARMLLGMRIEPQRHQHPQPFPRLQSVLPRK